MIYVVAHEPRPSLSPESAAFISLHIGIHVHYTDLQIVPLQVRTARYTNTSYLGTARHLNRSSPICNHDINPFLIASFRALLPRSGSNDGPGTMPQQPRALSEPVNLSGTCSS